MIPHPSKHSSCKATQVENQIMSRSCVKAYAVPVLILITCFTLILYICKYILIIYEHGREILVHRTPRTSQFRKPAAALLENFRHGCLSIVPHLCGTLLDATNICGVIWDVEEEPYWDVYPLGWKLAISNNSVVLPSFF